MQRTKCEVSFACALPYHSTNLRRIKIGHDDRQQTIPTGTLSQHLLAAAVIRCVRQMPIIAPLNGDFPEAPPTGPEVLNAGLPRVLHETIGASGIGEETRSTTSQLSSFASIMLSFVGVAIFAVLFHPSPSGSEACSTCNQIA